MQWTTGFACATLALTLGLGCSSEASRSDGDASAGAPSASAGADSESNGGQPSVVTGQGGQGQGNQPQGEAGEAAGPGEPMGSVPAELVGIWQQTRASGGDYTNGNGEDFSITSGFSVELRIRENGAYAFTHFASGVSPTCGQVTYLDQSVGSAELEGDQLVLHPREHELQVDDCERNEVEQVPLEPIAFDVSIEESQFFYSGLRTYILNLTGGPHPFALTLLHRPPSAEPEQPPVPDDFTLGDSPPFEELQGLWAPAAGTDSDFFDPETGDFYFPELNGSPHQWLRFAGPYYERAVALQNINPEGVCKMDAIYYERGEALFAVLEDVGSQGSHFVGHAQLTASAARLIVRIRECDVDDEVLQYDLPPQVSYYRWIYFSPDKPPESFTLQCQFPQSEWQGMLCSQESTGFDRRN
jgi:hypothetical protein